MARFRPWPGQLGSGLVNCFAKGHALVNKNDLIAAVADSADLTRAKAGTRGRGLGRDHRRAEAEG